MTVISWQAGPGREGGWGRGLGSSGGVKTSGREAGR